MMPIEPHRRELAAKGITKPKSYWVKYAEARKQDNSRPARTKNSGGCKRCQIITDPTDA